MKLIKTPQELKPGKKYYCRDKAAPVNGEKKIVVMTVDSDGQRRCLMPGRFWCYDKNDRILSYDGRSRVDKVLQEHGPDYNVAVFPSDYEENNQAMERWDIIGPVPEIPEYFVQALFDNPVLIGTGELVMSFYRDDDFRVLVTDEDRADGIFIPLFCKEDVDELLLRLDYESMQKTMVSDH